jgi:hypothetical protein
MAGGRLILPHADPAISSSGLLQTGATLTVYLAGTTTLATLYSDSGLTVPIANPQTSNSAGLFYQQSTTIWANSSQAYDCLLAFPDGETFTYLGLYLVASPATTGFAPLASPAFTGIPTAPTPSTGTSTTQLATTQFVANSLATLGVATPTVAGLVQLAGISDVLTGTSSTLAVTPASLQTAARTLAANGHITLPNGLIANWGASTSTGTSADNAVVTFASVTGNINFPNGALLSIATVTGNISGNYTVKAGVSSTTYANFTCCSATGTIASGISFNYLVIGY